MLLESVAYARPDTVAEALEALASSDGAAPLAGGQSLVNVLKHRVASVELLVDISRLEELRQITRTSDGGLEIGACVTYDELDHSDEIRSSHPLLAEVAGHIEDQQIRDRGTIGGNCCLSDPTNNLPPLLVALDAKMVIQSASGQREVPAAEFFQGYFATAVGEGELLRSITVPPLGADAGAGYSTVAVGADSKAIARAAAVVRGDGTIQEARVVLACVSPAPMRHGGMEEALRGAEASVDAVRAAAERIGDDLEPLGDAHGSAEYRRAMARVVARRAVCQAMVKGGN
ncbi:MAG TPA: xanthine dehydrogenase family protein subunit M [Solirubrobacteraceae bacterium]|nr:xanthine dehydrogenase family protein subunit M [Solirubrobacteraceae bacterium]